MKLFSFLYDKTITWARHRYATRYLATLSFAESSFFPIPPDVMLMPMVMATPERWKWLASLTTISSVLGGLAGYAVGYWAFDLLQPYLLQWGYGNRLARAAEWFSQWGVWIVLAAGFSPIPYKIFTISAGALHMALLPFIFASILGRGARFFAVSALLTWLGPKMEPLILRYIEWLGWLVVAALVITILIIQV